MENDLIPEPNNQEMNIYRIPNSSKFAESLSLTFAGWYTDDGTEWDFEAMRVTSDLVLYAGWKDDQGRLYKVYKLDDDIKNIHVINCVREDIVGTRCRLPEELEEAVSDGGAGDGS